MEILVGNEPVVLKGRQPVKNGESPSSMVEKMDGTTTVIGSMQINVQLVVTSPKESIEPFHEILAFFRSKGSELDGLTIFLVIKDGGVNPTELIGAVGELPIEIVKDPGNRFAERFGLILSGGPRDRDPVPSVFVIDKEGVFSHVEIAQEIDGTVDLEKALQAARDSASTKKKGHHGSHMHDW